MTRNTPTYVAGLRDELEDRLHEYRKERDAIRAALAGIDGMQRRLQELEGHGGSLGLIDITERELTDAHYPACDVNGLRHFVIEDASPDSITLRFQRGTHRVTVRRSTPNGGDGLCVRRIIHTHYDAILSQWNLWCARVGTPPNPKQTVYGT